MLCEISHEATAAARCLLRARSHGELVPGTTGYSVMMILSVYCVARSLSLLSAGVAVVWGLALSAPKRTSEPRVAVTVFGVVCTLIWLRSTREIAPVTGKVVRCGSQATNSPPHFLA